MAKDILSAKKLINVRGELLDLSRPRIMGIMNVTPDSFYSGSRMDSEKIWLSKAEQMIEEGATFLDVGGYSSRPGAADIPVEEEVKRVEKAVKSIRERFEVYVSIDTFRSEVANVAVDCGADIVNDISGGELDPGMFDFLAERKLPYIMMHMRGTPQTMRELTDYDNLLTEITDYFAAKLNILNDRGIDDVIIDVGFGFAKSIDQNYEILRNLDYFEVLGRPVLVGVSRKSMIFKTLGTDAAGALNGSTVLHTMGLLKGASILRVHDVKEAGEVITLVERYKGNLN